MPNKPSLGETLRMLGSGGARSAGNAIVESKKRKKKKLDEIMSGLESDRKRSK